MRKVYRGGRATGPRSTYTLLYTCFGSARCMQSTRVHRTEGAAMTFVPSVESCCGPRRTARSSGSAEVCTEQIIHCPRLDQASRFPTRKSRLGNTKPLREILLAQLESPSPVEDLLWREKSRLGTQCLDDLIVYARGEEQLATRLTARGFQDAGFRDGKIDRRAPPRWCRQSLRGTPLPSCISRRSMGTADHALLALQCLCVQASWIFTT